jgi:hypothetical protein
MVAPVKSLVDRAIAHGIFSPDSRDGRKQMIIAGLLAGRGVYKMAERVIQRCVDDPLIQAVWVLTAKDRVGNPKFMMQDKIWHINSWVGEDSHNKTGLNRERIRSEIYGRLSEDRFSGVKWIWCGDDDGLPALDYFEKLAEIEYAYPVLLTGKTFNMDGSRWYDWCTFGSDHAPFCIPYESWSDPRWGKDIYCSGNQHVMNRAAFDLNVPYPDHVGEDPWYCRAFRKAGGRLMLHSELSMSLLKLHPPASHGVRDSDGKVRFP